MNFLGNFKVGTKIIAGNIIALVLMLVVGGLAIIRLGQLNTTIVDLTDNLAVDRQAANEMAEQILLARFYAAKYTSTHGIQFLDRYKEESAILDGLLIKAKTDITNPERAALLEAIANNWSEYKSNFEIIQQLIVDRDRAQTEILDVQGPAGENAIINMRTAAYFIGDDIIVHDGAELQAGFNQMRLNSYKFLVAGDLQFLDQFMTRYEETQAAMRELERDMEPAYNADLAATKLAIETYSTAFQELKAGYAKQQDIQTNQLDVLGIAIREDASAIVDNIGAEFEAKAQETNRMVAQTRLVLIGTMLGAAVLGMILGTIISRGITAPLAQVTQVARQIAEQDLQNLTVEMGALAQGDLTRQIQVKTSTLKIRSNDEIGSLAIAFNAMIDRLRETGQAFGDMTSNLHSLIGQVAENADAVGAAAAQLSQTANQAGQATTQIATTIQQVAIGNSQQTLSVSQTAESVDLMGRAIDGVAIGAQEQAVSINKASSLTIQISKSVEQVTGNAQAVKHDSAEAAQAAKDGYKTVHETIQGMESIKTKVGLSAAKVQEMGARSDQIGVIVETIDEIASQTNLLALNAAIEAARAGDHGKGFAVVADEVRKLAERSSQATKEIGLLIRGIQTAVKDAVSAMNEGAKEVETGVERANNAGHALESITQAAESVYQQSGQAVKAADQMKVAVSELVEVVESVSAVVEENTAATEEMSANAHEVTEAIENIASVSEENAASVEEVSASAEEMSAQVEEVSASAHSLEEMAQALQAVVSKFKLSNEEIQQGQVPAFTSAPLSSDPIVPLNGNGHKTPQIPSKSAIR